MIRIMHQHQQQRLGFSLVEVLLAIFILGLGVISIVSLFPAGIAQQRQSVDDIIGPIVAQNAIATIRTRVRPEDFGTPEEFGDPTYTIDGDFRWSRPAFYTSGDLNLFVDLSSGIGTISELPWNTFIYGNEPPDIRIPQTERYYPMRSTESNDPRQPRPEYVWDCMFRRFQGKIMVAIFVYRTAIVGGGSFAYSVPPQPPPNQNVPPMPVWLDLEDSEALELFPYGSWDAPVNTNPLIDGTKAGEPYVTTDQLQSWQEPGQWILDQNNNLHRVMSRNRESLSVDVEVELVRQPAQVLDLPIYFFPGNVADINNDGLLDIHVISDIFYIPREVTINPGPAEVSVRLTPVYVTVREL